jgi:hypothetical protein
MSLILDPPLLLASGAAIERLAAEEPARRRCSAAALALFLGVSALLYANAPGLGPIWRPFGCRSGRDFMLGSGLLEVDQRALTPRRHAALLAQFALYPLWLHAGRALARRAEGRP